MDNATTAKRAGGLLMDPRFLFRVSQAIGSLGVVREMRNRLIVFVAVLTTIFDDPVSVLVKGHSSSGKSTLIRNVLKIFRPLNMVVERSGLSPKALNFGGEKLDRRVLYIPEVRAVKVAQTLLRLVQSEGVLTYERTSVSGPETITLVTQRVGCPVVLTTTTDERLFEDDETRFFSIWIDESPEQTREILKVKLHPLAVDRLELAGIQRAVWALLKLRIEIELPRWLEIVIDQMPAQVRVRRDALRFFRLVQAITLTRYFRSGAHDRRKMTVELCDYAVAWRLLNEPLTRSASDIPFATGQVVKAAETIFEKSCQAVSAKQIAAHLACKQGSVYPHLNRAEELGLLRYDGKSRQNNEKRYIPTGARRDDFLVSPQKLLGMCPQLEPCEYVDPITGNTAVVTREQRRAPHKEVQSESLKPKPKRFSAKPQSICPKLRHS